MFKTDISVHPWFKVLTKLALCGSRTFGNCDCGILFKGGFLRTRRWSLTEIVQDNFSGKLFLN